MPSLLGALGGAVTFAPNLQAQGTNSNAAATSTTCAPVIPTHQTDDILICSAVNWAPNTAGTIADMTISNGWVAFGTVADTGVDGTIQQWWRRATSSSETNPTITRTSDTGSDTGFQGCVWVIRGCAKTGDPWDAVASSGATAITAANGTIPAVTVSGASRLVACFFACQDDQANGSTPSGWSAVTRTTFTIGTDGQFQALYKDNQSANSSSIATTISAPVQGGYSFTVVSFKP